MLFIFVKHALVADKFTMEAVLTETLVNEALLESIVLLETFVKHALVEEKFIIKAEFMEATS